MTQTQTQETTKRRAPAKARTLTERRLRDGAEVLKTYSLEARHGAFWTYPDGKVAAANVCSRLERLGLLVADDGLFPDCGGQTYHYAVKPLAQ